MTLVHVKSKGLLKAHFAAFVKKRKETNMEWRANHNSALVIENDVNVVNMNKSYET